MLKTLIGLMIPLGILVFVHRQKSIEASHAIGGFAFIAPTMSHLCLLLMVLAFAVWLIIYVTGNL